METEARTRLNDVLDAADAIHEFTLGKTFSDYTDDRLLRSATERQFEIIGEAMSRLARVDEPTAARITDYRRIISFRNLLIHEYESVESRVVWDALQFRFPTLVFEVEALLKEE